MQPGLVSIMMPAYNAERYVEEAIASALAQSYPRWELVIVDDGSTDRTGALAAAFKDARIKIVRQENKGEAGARNSVLQVAEQAHAVRSESSQDYLPAGPEFSIQESGSSCLSSHP
ncbi:MAG: glycosyltransferase family 2 protein [Chloroflexota bacterium]